ncbi:helix-turn-helix transcriptional regulator [Novosphingopyxis sp.]|uniref:helix-turn-helix transcriptional regulator n=1 Tax=Novosphingopyxis sp. TaxID=2709690 RepID=UPI003B58B844
MYSRALKLMRQYHRLNQKELSKLIDISPSYVSELENGRKDPSLDILTRYSSEFGIPLSSILFFAERSSGDRIEGARAFVADKTLKMLEWIAEESEVNDESHQKRALTP